MSQQTRWVDYTMIALASVFGFGPFLLMIVRGSSSFTDFRMSQVNILLWDTFLSLIFFAQHSVMVRRSFRVRLSPGIQERYQGAIYSIASGISLAMAVIFWQRSEVSLAVLQGIPRLIAAAFSLLAVLVLALSFYALRSFDPLGISPVRAHLRARKHQPGQFVLRGPYRWVRHPLYSCTLVLFWASPDVTADRLLLNLLWTAWICIGTLLEEHDLAREFGDIYRQYQKTVPMLVPWRGPVAKAALDF